MTTNVLICDDSGFARRQMARSIPDAWDVNISFAEHGKDAIEQMQDGKGDVLFLDRNMPVMDGYETMQWIKENRPDTNVLVLSMDDEEHSIIKMLRLGAKGYLLKDIHPEILRKALNEVITNGIYYSERVATTLLNSITGEKEKNQKHKNILLIFHVRKLVIDQMSRDN